MIRGPCFKDVRKISSFPLLGKLKKLNRELSLCLLSSFIQLCQHTFIEQKQTGITEDILSLVLRIFEEFSMW